MNEIVCYSRNESIYLFQSIGIQARIVERLEDFRGELRELLNSDAKIAIIDEDLREDISDLLDDFDEKAYPIILFLPFRKHDLGMSIEKMKVSIESAIGVNILGG